MNSWWLFLDLLQHTGPHESGNFLSIAYFRQQSVRIWMVKECLVFSWHLTSRKNASTFFDNTNFIFKGLRQSLLIVEIIFGKNLQNSQLKEKYLFLFASYVRDVLSERDDFVIFKQTVFCLFSKQQESTIKNIKKVNVIQKRLNFQHYNDLHLGPTGFLPLFLLFYLPWLLSYFQPTDYLAYF